MKLEEHAAKSVVLRPAGAPVGNARLCASPNEVAEAVRAVGPAVVKAQVPSGKRGKAGGIKVAETPEEGADVARKILGMTIGGDVVERVLVEEKAAIAREFYAAVLIDVANRAPLVLFSTEGGMDIEEIALDRPDAIRRHVVDVLEGFGEPEAKAMLRGLDLGNSEAGDDVLGVAARAVGQHEAPAGQPRDRGREVRRRD